MDRQLLVGWSYGVALAAHWADRNPDGPVRKDFRAVAEAGRETAAVHDQEGSSSR